jgi:hypothetical protein
MANPSPGAIPVPNDQADLVRGVGDYMRREGIKITRGDVRLMLKSLT